MKIILSENLKLILTLFFVLFLIFLSPPGVFAGNLDRVFQLVQQDLESTSSPLASSPSTGSGDGLLTEQSNPTEMGYLARGMIFGYQKLLSTQDKPSCVFTPSCSQFGVACFQHFHPLKAGLLTSDRLQRCHLGAFKHYKLDSVAQRLKDPIQTYE